MTYYDMFCNLYQDDKCIELDYSHLCYILGVDSDVVGSNLDVETKLLGSLNGFVEQGFNEGVRFAIKFFLGGF